MTARLEHVNFTTSDPDATAQMLCDVFGWTIRWSGPALNGGRTVHVGSDDDYVAIYSPAGGPGDGGRAPERLASLNHVGVVVGDLDAVEARTKAAGLTPMNHGSYAPGRRFYFLDADGIEYEVVSYD
ncbi:MAG: VOC family protein [Alphaproteobacteria bacterium]|nr:VOC family protein [Alphaproteobacteria bacterium]